MFTILLTFFFFQDYLEHFEVSYIYIFLYFLFFYLFFIRECASTLFMVDNSLPIVV